MADNLADGDVVMKDKQPAEAAVAVVANTQTQPTAKVKIEKKRKMMAPRSIVWKQFKRSQNEDGEWRGTCIYCQIELACDSKYGTNGMKNHMKKCKEVPHSNDTKQTEMSTYVHPDGSKTVGPWKFDQEGCKKALALMIIEDELPFRFVEGVGFKKFMATVQNRFVVPSRNTITRFCYKMYVDEKVRLKAFLMSNCDRISITTDTWTSIQRINYMVVTAHFIDNDWILHKKVLNFCPITSHKGDAIGKTLEKCLIDWGVNKVFTITVDNASSNDLVVAWIKKKMNQWGTNICEGEFVHVRCIAHIVNLMVLHGLTTVGTSIIRIREAVRYIRQSPSRLSKFKECAERDHVASKALLCLDVCTRWNSTYLMLETALKFEKTFEAYEDVDPFYRMELVMREEKRKNKRKGKSNEEDLADILMIDDEESLEDDGVQYVNASTDGDGGGGGGVPKEDDWVNARRLCKTLKYFYDLTCFVSGSKYVTANAYFDHVSNVATMLRAWENSSDIELTKLAGKMHEKFDKYWGHVGKFNSLLYIAAVFDPRKKMDYVAFALLDVYGEFVGKELGEKVRRDTERIYVAYWELYGKRKEHNVVGDTAVEKGGCSGGERVCEGSELINAREERFRRFKEANGGGSLQMKSELDSYLQENIIEGGKSFSILDWWKKHAPRFPILSRMAKDILAVQVSTVASESAFSTGGRVLDPFRSSLTPLVVQGLICSQDWFRSSRESMKLKEDLAELQQWEDDISQMLVETTITEV